MALLQCSIEDGPRPGYKAIGVASIEGRTEYLAIEERFLVRRGDTYLLPVRLIGATGVTTPRWSSSLSRRTAAPTACGSSGSISPKPQTRFPHDPLRPRSRAGDGPWTDRHRSAP